MKSTLHLTGCGLFMMLRNLILAVVLFAIPVAAVENVKAFGAVAKANIKAVSAVAEANIKAIGAVDNTGGGAAPAFGAEVSCSANYVVEDDSTTQYTVSEAVAGGRRLVLAMSLPSPYTVTVSDSRGNAWTTHAEPNDGFNVAAIASCHVATALESGDTITLTWSSGGFLGKNWVLVYLTGCASSGQPDVS